MVSLQLKDGGHITGQPLTSALPFHTDFAKIEIPWSSVTKCELAASNAPSVLWLKNGDQLRGQVGLEKLKLETPLGKMTIPMTEVLLLTVRQGGAGCGLDGLVLYYPFDEDTGDVVPDASGNGNDGKVFGARWTPNGRIGGAYQFAGASRGRNYIRVSHSPSLGSMQRTRQLTLALWIKPRAFAHMWPSLLSTGGGQMPHERGGYELTLNSQADNDICFLSDRYWIITQNAMGKWINNHVDEWIHVAVVIDAENENADFFVNGQKTGDLTWDTRFPGSAKHCNFDVQDDLLIGGIGQQPSNGRSSYDGLMDELMIFNRALSAEEVADLYRRDSALMVNTADAKAVDAQAKLPIKAQIELADGSHLVGELQPDELDLRTTGLGKMSVPFRLIRSIQFSEGGKRVAASLTHGDKLVGEPLFSELKVMAAFGRVTLATSQLHTLTFMALPKNAAPSGASK